MTNKRWHEFFFGKPRNPEDTSVHRQISLIAILAWVGLGADGLSSSCYGPEETFKALGAYRHLAPYLALATVITVSVLSAAYSSTIVAFPSGGGGYTVATRTLGRAAGMICGCALVLDYVLTAAISVAAGADAIFNFLPPEWRYSHDRRLLASLAGLAALMILNFRGVKESVKLLVPVFVLFLVSHAILIVCAVFARAPATSAGLPAAAPSLAFGAAFVLLLQAFSRGAGTYTGIEAISNSLTILREPRVHTARRAMLYMAISLSVVAGGLILGYRQVGVAPAEGQTLNAVLAEATFGGGAVAAAFVKVTLISEALLLLVAAQAGFIDGPRVLASMAVDSWVPRWFSRLSDRLVVSRGILFIGLVGLAAIFMTFLLTDRSGGQGGPTNAEKPVDKLVVIYSFCVFVTFLFSQTGMARYWFQHREAGWLWRGLVSVTAALISVTILVGLFLSNSLVPAGIALGAILLLVGLCALFRWHCASVGRSLKRLDPLITAAESDPHHVEPRPWDRDDPTAVFLVSGYTGAGMHTILGVQRIFPGYFHQMIFAAVGVVDFDRFKGQREVENLHASVQGDLKRYVQLAEKWGYAAESRAAFGVDLIQELEGVCAKVAQDYPRAVFFCGDLIFHMPSALTGLLHARTAEELQRRLRDRGLPLLIIPIRV